MSATLRTASSVSSRRPPSDADSRIVRNERQVVEPIERPGEREIGDQRRDRRCCEEAQPEIVRSERNEREGQGRVENEEHRLQDEEHDAAVEIERQRRAGDEQELEHRSDQAHPQGADLAELHVEQADDGRRQERDQRADHQLRNGDAGQ